MQQSTAHLKNNYMMQKFTKVKWKEPKMFPSCKGKLGCPKMHKRWKCHAPEAKSDAKTLIFWENIKIWAVN